MFSLVYIPIGQFLAGFGQRDPLRSKAQQDSVPKKGEKHHVRETISLKGGSQTRPFVEISDFSRAQTSEDVAPCNTAQSGATEK